MKRISVIFLLVCLLCSAVSCIQLKPTDAVPGTTAGATDAPETTQPNLPDTPALPAIAWTDAETTARLFQSFSGGVVNTSRREYSYGEMVQDLGELGRLYPERFSYRSFGKSVLGRELYVATLGNPEARQKRYRDLRSALDQTGAEILINRHVRVGEVIIGGWYDPEVVKEPERLSAMEREEGVKILLCHKPEMYMQRMRSRQFDLVVAGHAHGGQIRLFGRGLYAPGQGILPRYTKGVYDGRMIVSAGAGNPARMPRWWNPCEVLLIRID